MDFRIMTAIRRIAASNPYSAPASGGNNVESIDTDPEITEHTLYGAVVAGPDKWDDFYNIRSDWPQTGVALDFNASMLTLAAMRVMSDDSDPFYILLRVNAHNDACPRRMTQKDTIVMAVIIIVVGIAIVGLGSYWIYLLRMHP